MSTLRLDHGSHQHAGFHYRIEQVFRFTGDSIDTQGKVTQEPKGDLFDHLSFFDDQAGLDDYVKSFRM